MSVRGKEKSVEEIKQVLRADGLAEVPWLVHGFSTRIGGVSQVYRKGDLNLGFTQHDSRANVEKNRSIFLKALGWKKTSPLITLKQVHSDTVLKVDAPPNAPLVGDGMITNVPGILLAVQTADCLPVIVADPKHRAIGVFHAGWRGTLARIVEKGVGLMHMQFGTNASDLVAAIGPGIHSCCYEVGDEVRDKFLSQFEYGPALFHEQIESDPVREKYPLLFLTARAPGHSHGLLPKKIFLDLVEANRRQLLAAGVKAKNIEASRLCTQCNVDKLFSFRAEKGKTGRMMAVAGIRP